MLPWALSHYLKPDRKNATAQHIQMGSCEQMNPAAASSSNQRAMTQTKTPDEARKRPPRKDTIREGCRD